MSGLQISVGRIVLFTLFGMSLGAFIIGFVSISGIQSFRKEFSRLVEQDLPQATAATRLNAEISGLTSQVGLLATAISERAVGTIRIQISDQLDAISRQKDQFRKFAFRPDQYPDIDNALSKLTSNLELLTNLILRRISDQEKFSAISMKFQSLPVSTEANLRTTSWVLQLEKVQKSRDTEALAQQISTLQDSGGNTTRIIALANQLLSLKRSILNDQSRIDGRLNFHRRLAAELTDSTRFMSSRLISDTKTRSNAIFDLFRTNSYLVLVSLLGFATFATFIYVYLDKHVVARIQKLTQRINGYEAHEHISLPNGGNEIITIEASFTNLTETIAEREQRLVALNAVAIDARRDAEKASESKSKLLAAASHDLRQPLHAMGLLIGGIDTTQLDKPSLRTLEQLATLTRETEGLFNSILELSKLEAGTFTAIREPVDVAELFDRVKLDFSQRATMAGAKFIVIKPDKEVFVLGDGQALYRIIANLVTNAIQYARQGTIKLTGQVRDNEFVLMVSDNGPGLTFDTDMKLDKERKAEAPSENNNESYGLGLSICFALADAMKTELQLTSSVSDGTQFVLPLQRVANSKMREAPKNIKSTTPSLKGLSIVLLEDNPDVRTVTYDGLSRLGCDVTACVSTEHAKTSLTAAHGPTLLLTDLDLGRGHSASRFIQVALDTAPNLIGVIVTTATPSKVDVNISEHEKIQILEKPFSIGRLASLIRYMTLNNPNI